MPIWTLAPDSIAAAARGEAWPAPEERRDPPFRSELTPEGEQLVIPGCERNRSARLRQLDLFG